MHTTEKSALIAVLLVALIIRRQLRTRPVRRNGSLVLPIALGGLGALAIAFAAASAAEDDHPLTPLPIALLAASLAVAAGFGAIRARTVRVWRDPEAGVLRKGTPATTALWLASATAHFALALWIDHATDTTALGTASLYAYIAIGLGTQNLLVRGRATTFSEPAAA
ncbi:hypothetical protein [Streptomyces sp. NPDC018610]|uniref:hypothetical protein n=1 Tax=Streptomyces sp. NPDC018610 TaxID=3365049 RepID=UPI0037B70070